MDCSRCYAFTQLVFTGEAFKLLLPEGWERFPEDPAAWRTPEARACPLLRHPTFWLAFEAQALPDYDFEEHVDVKLLEATHRRCRFHRQVLHRIFHRSRNNRSQRKKESKTGRMKRSKGILRFSRSRCGETGSTCSSVAPIHRSTTA